MTTIYPVSNIEHKENLRTTINQAIRQVSDISGTVNSSGAGAINITNTKIYLDSVIILTPRNLSASTTTFYIGNISEGSATIHFNGPGLYDYVIIGVR